MKEIWKPFRSGYYEASTLGRVRRKSTRRICTEYPNDQGYLRLCLSEKGKETWIFAHVVVAEVFLGPKPEGKQVNHKDGVKSKNNVGNLEYQTPKGNMEHACRLGLIARGERNGWHTKPNSHHRRLTEVQVRRLRKEYRNSDRSAKQVREIWTKYGISRAMLYLIMSKQAYKHVMD